MPHILFKKTDNSFDKYFEIDNYKYEKIAHCNYSKDGLIVVSYFDTEFILIKKNKKNGTLIKIDKATKTTPMDITKNGIINFGKFHNLEILFSNIKNDKKQLKTNSIVAIELFQDEQYFKNLQNNYDNIFMEIGFGSGRHIINKAIQNPTFLYIGVEIYTASIEQLNNLINIQNINNIIIVHYDARQLLNIFPAKYLETIYIHFPVPWDDKPHRRVINKDFINQVIRTLKTNGSLNLRTDSLKYYEYCKQLLDCYDNIQTKINNNIDIASKYEDRWKKLKKNIYDITFINKNSDFIDNSRYDFVFLDKITKRNMSKIDNRKTFVFEDHFLSFGSIYDIDEFCSIFVLSMGAFDRPTKRYVMIKYGFLRYFQNKPITTKENIKAHKNLLEVLYDN
ncbi:MAG: tRNA (guanosine(46)-N7)-methyltransferase TrmB [Epsilonproteobacteria bacterium]|nr:MAG: tRNA (guanosine(46)-N7)-methyltransferase TrmB [Campylobacterota bacterium]